MGRRLQNIDLSTVARLSLAHVAADDTEAHPKGEAPVKPLIAYTEEDVHFTQIAQEFPLVAELQQRLNLVSEETGRPHKLLTEEQIKTFVRHQERAQDAAVLQQLEGIAQKAFQGERIYSKEEALDILQDQLRITRERATKGLQMLFDHGLLEPIAEGGTLYLGGSTPF